MIECIFLRGVIKLPCCSHLGGGTILAAAVETGMVRRKNDLHAPHSQFEDGTLNFYGILALRHGFTILNRMGGMVKIQQYLMDLTQYAINAIVELSHVNGSRLCEVYRPDGIHKLHQGPIVTFNLYQSNGLPIGFDFIAKRAATAVIFISDYLIIVLIKRFLKFECRNITGFPAAHRLLLQYRIMPTVFSDD